MVETLFRHSITERMEEAISELSSMPLAARIDAINALKMRLHEISPFKDEPVDCVIWVENSLVMANDYNPNSVAPPEMKLLERSIEADGYTQPIVAWERDSIYEVVDGFHRNRVGKESKSVRNRVHGYLPLSGYKAIPEEAPPELEAKCWAPSWRRMCKVLLRNDYWCKGLGQTQPKSDAYQKYKKIKQARKESKNPLSPSGKQP